MSKNLKDQEQAISDAFMESLKSIEGSTKDRESRLYLVENVVPYLVPAITSLLKAEEKKRLKQERGIKTYPIQPMHYLAKYLYRHNPRHCEESKESNNLKELSEQLQYISTMR